MRQRPTVHLQVLELESRCLLSGLPGIEADPLGQPFDQPEHPRHNLAAIQPWKKPEPADTGAGAVSTQPPRVAEPAAAPVHAAPPVLPVAIQPASGSHRGGTPPTVQETVTSAAGGGSWVVNKNHSETTKTAWGFFGLLNARSYNSLARPTDDIHTIWGGWVATPYQTNGVLNSYATRNTNKLGAKYTAHAIAMGTVTAAGAVDYTWTAVGSKWGVDIDPTVGIVPGESAVANIRIQDPVTFPDLSPTDGPFSVQFTPDGSWSVDFPPQNPDEGIVYDASVSISGSAGSSIAGYGNIFSYEIDLAPGSVQVQVTSSPRLGWDNNYVAQSIANSYSWDGEYMTYNGGPLLATGIPIPACGGQADVAQIGLHSDCISQATFSMDQNVEATVTSPA
jgi:hypothetical protein